jgi:hypothetical protein
MYRAANVVLDLIGANLNWPEEFHLHVDPRAHASNARDIWIFAMYDIRAKFRAYFANVKLSVNAATYLSASLV